MSNKSRREIRILAKELLYKMHHPKAWKIRIWYNLYWCFALKAKCGYISLYPLDQSSKTLYSCLMSSEKDSSGGLSAWTDSKHFLNPNEAVRHTLDNARNYTNKLNEAIQSVNEISTII